MHQITPSIFSTNILNPNMRVFDIVMRTEYGTSYNSYVLVGFEKIALIESSHRSFTEAYLQNVEETLSALGGKIPDYLVMNHNEPDHSGAVAALLERYPALTIVTSQAGAIYLKSITNRSDLNLMVVKDGDSISLGDKTLQFVNAPFLHWPDSMFTYVPEERTVFTCDFLGAHYCEPQLLDTCVTYRDAYIQAVREYFEAIFGPFKPYVLKGLEKLERLDVAWCCPSHGPILTAGCEYERNQQRYRKWATPATRSSKRIPVFYVSAYGNTERLATYVARGLLEALPNAEVACYDLNQHELTFLAAEMNASDAFLLGSPTINRDALPPVLNLLAAVDAVTIAKRPVALFGSYGWSGEALPHLAERLNSLKCAVFEPQLKVCFTPTDDDLTSAKNLGRNFALSL
jgi:flavorubredoxin